MIWVALVAAEILGYCLIFNLLAGIPFAVGPAVYAAGVILTLYLADFVGLLQPVSYVVHAGGFAALAATAWLAKLREQTVFFRNRDETIKAVLTIALFAFVVIWLVRTNAGGSFSSWDEFSHWGTIIRAVVEANSFRLDPNPLYVQDYPPGTALFSYHLIQLIGYSEGNAFTTYSVLTLCFAASIIGTAGRIGPLAVVAAFLIVYRAIIALGGGWSSVLIDHVLGMVFAGCIVSYYTISTYSTCRKALFAIPPLLGALTLIKHAGVTLAMLAVLICVIDSTIQRYMRTDNGWSQRAWLGWVGAMLAVPLVIAGSWRLYVSLGNLTVSWIDYSPFKVLPSALACCTSSREMEVAGKFFGQLFRVSPAPEQPASLAWYFFDALQRSLTIKPNLPIAFSIFILIAMGGGLALTLSRPLKIRALVLILGLAAGCFAYTFSLLLAYLYAFSDFEGRGIISFSRYLKVFVLIILIIVVMIAIWAAERLSPISRRIIMAIVLVTALLSTKTIDLIRPPHRPIADFRRIVGSWTARIDPKLPKNATVYIIWQTSNGLELWVTKYELTPRFTNVHCWSLGEPIITGDLYPCRYKAEEVAKQFQKFDYVAVGKGLGNLKMQYPTLFEDAPNTDTGLFKVETDRGRLRLRYVELSKAAASRP